MGLKVGSFFEVINKNHIIGSSIQTQNKSWQFTKLTRKNKSQKFTNLTRQERRSWHNNKDKISVTKETWSTQQKRRKQITKIIEFCSIYIVIDQGKDRREKRLEEGDAEVEEEDSASAEDTMSGENSTVSTT